MRCHLCACEGMQLSAWVLVQLKMSKGSGFVDQLVVEHPVDRQLPIIFVEVVPSLDSPLYLLFLTKDVAIFCGGFHRLREEERGGKERVKDVG